MSGGMWKQEVVVVSGDRTARSGRLHATSRGVLAARWGGGRGEGGGEVKVVVGGVGFGAAGLAVVVVVWTGLSARARRSSSA